MIARLLRGAAAFLAVASLAGCSRLGTGAGRPGLAEARNYYYADNSGLRVLTTAAVVEQKISQAVTALARLTVDRISVDRKVLDPGDPGALAQLTGHHDADAVTSASAVAGGGGVAEKWRTEGLVGAELETAPGGRPARVRLYARGSTEPDYKSLSAQLQGSIELGDRNTTLAGFVGGGNDWVDPVEKPPGHQAEWPAQHQRLVLGGSVSQLLSPRLAVGAGLGITLQHGMLSSPYRRALVLAAGGASGTLFPEVLPRDRQRYTGFGSLSWFVGRGLAAHLQLGGYADSWGVRAVVPEVTLGKDFAARRGLLLGRYRYYSQGAASFHESHYHSLDARYLSGDPRLSDLEDHTVGVELRWVLLRSPASSLGFSLGYDLSQLTYHEEDSDTQVVAHLPMLNLSGAY